MAANGMDPLVFTDDVTADRSIRMNSEVYKPKLSTYIHTNTRKVIGQSFSLQMDDDPEMTTKTT